jgi:hypothetical protein
MKHFIIQRAEKIFSDKIKKIQINNKTSLIGETFEL